MRDSRPVFFYSVPSSEPGWHRHGVTTKDILVLLGGELCWILLRKQRWLHPETGRTRHDRPVWDRPGSPYALDVVFAALSAWLRSALGLHRITWPWTAERPSRRTVQRWRARLAPQAQRWLQAIRLTVIELVAPRPLEEVLAVGGIPPPQGRTRRDRCTAQARQLTSSAQVLRNAAHLLQLSVGDLLIEVHRRHSATLPIVC